MTCWVGALLVVGLEGAVGLPNPKLRATMESEHCHRDDSKVFFKTGNYSVKTKSWYEWYFVIDPEGGAKIFMEEDQVDWLSGKTEQEAWYPTEEENLALRKQRHAVPLASLR